MEAGRWAGESALGFTMSRVEQGMRKISFRAPCGSFYVTVPENMGSEEWVSIVWLVWVDQLAARHRLYGSLIPMTLL